MSDATFIAYVRYGHDADVGTVYVDEYDILWVEWPDGYSDMVFRDANGGLWDEFGDDQVPEDARGRKTPSRGKRLIEVDSSDADVAAAVLAQVPRPGDDCHRGESGGPL